MTPSRIKNIKRQYVSFEFCSDKEKKFLHAMVQAPLFDTLNNPQSNRLICSSDLPNLLHRPYFICAFIFNSSKTVMIIKAIKVSY